MLAGCAALLLGTTLHAQALNTSLLKPPPGARVAIVEFDDLECPACAHANPLLEQAAAKYKIPWIRHDFLIPYHIWSKTAAIDARWFDTRNKALGDAYRNEVFAHQISIETPLQLLQFTQRFAQSHGVALPFAVDPQGKLLAEINADNALGTQIGLTLTPSIFIVTAGSKGASSIQVKDPDHDLYSAIDQAIAATRH
ncbi:MAG TPA: thioredoxin domain-containing protein [Terracidiphilus sp.]